MEHYVETQPQGTARPRVSWNKGKLIGQKAPLKLKEIYAIRIHLQLDKRVRELALFISPSTASYGAAIWLSYEYAMSCKVIV